MDIKANIIIRMCDREQIRSSVSLMNQVKIISCQIDVNPVTFIVIISKANRMTFHRKQRGNVRGKWEKLYRNLSFVISHDIRVIKLRKMIG
jgi:hypothetical protein